eukprot:TRINITY_DN2876_c0_g1_i2.p1 TRINITY_DN2876_c0_g1~~TRINITY_DN2876_c0_g1_i2.p1  ORF type:complete len:174 (-),score=45.23 TRINITY_DN2876_c0_g1_i2:253-741(-)
MPARSNQEKLEDLLAEVKSLYKQKYGESVDDEGQDFEYDEDGTLWVKSITMPSRPNQEKLEGLLGEVKDLYMLRYGESVDDDSADVPEEADRPDLSFDADDYADFYYDSDGMLLIRAGPFRGSAPSCLQPSTEGAAPALGVESMQGNEDTEQPPAQSICAMQ